MIIEIVLVIVSYCVGSILFCQYIAKKYYKRDLTKEGSKNPGATNLYKLAGPIGILGGTLDMFKGLLPTLIAYTLNISEGWIYATGLAAMMGHIFPLWYKFKGGKGGATLTGVLITILMVRNQLVYSREIVILIGIYIITMHTYRHYQNLKKGVWSLKQRTNKSSKKRNR